MQILVCRKSNRVYVDPAQAAADGCNILEAEEHELDIEGLDAIIHRANGRGSSAHRQIDDAMAAGCEPGTTLAVLPIVRPSD